MEKCTLFQMKSQYRDDFRVEGYRFGKGKKALAVVGSMRGNEHQQLYVCSRLVKALRKIEEEGQIAENCEILIIPCANPYSMNIRKRFWTIDNTDINRMFPGYAAGETTQRIAAGVFDAVKDYEYGIQMASFYIRGTFMPHIRMMKTGFEDPDDAERFGFPYVMIREPQPFDTATLNYNWQIWNTKAFSLYTNGTGTIHKESAEEAAESVLNFMKEVRILKEESKIEKSSRIIHEEDIITVRTERAGFFEAKVELGQHIRKDQLIAVIEDPCTGEERGEIFSPEDGTLFFIHHGETIYADSTAAWLVKD